VVFRTIGPLEGVGLAFLSVARPTVRALLGNVLDAFGSLDVQVVAVVVAAISAIASAAFASRQSVDRAHRAFVWGEIEPHREATDPLRVRLRNDGPGVAYDVRWSVGSIRPKPGTDWEDDKYESDDEMARRHRSHVKRALRAGDTHPSADGWLERKGRLPDDDIWWVLVRWTDTAGVRWELTEQGPSMQSFGARRLRTHWWQRWRDESDW